MQVQTSVANDQLQVSSGAVTMAGVNFVKTTMTVPTSATALPLTNLTGIPPVLAIKNLDTTNYVEVDAVNTFNAFPQKVKPGGIVVLCPETATIYVRANTASCQIQYFACEP